MKFNGGIMSDNRELYSPFIQSGIIRENDYRIFGWLVSLFFGRMELDKESMLILDEHKGKGKIVYASMQTTYTSLFILINKLRQRSLPVPFLALGFVPYSYQRVRVFYSEMAVFFKKILRLNKGTYVPNSVYIARALEKDRAVAFSMLSRKLFFRRYVQIRTDAIEYLLELQKKMDEPIYIFPQVIFWNRNPEKSRSVFISEATGDRGLLTGLLIRWKSATPAFIRVGKPVNLKEEIGNEPGDDIRHLSRKVRNKILDIYNYEKRSILGPQIKTQQEMMEKVLYHKNVLEVIQQEMTDKGTSEKKLRKKAFAYFREIAADFSIVYIKFFEKANNYLFRKIFNKMYYNLEDFKKIREASNTGPIILVPSHKSHMDYIIISSLFYANKIIPPHILAGSNLTFFPMGKIFRRSGAFFMRRTFKGLNLYAAVFKQYVKTLVNEGYSIEVFIEGTRSRTGKVISPKMGIVKYLIEAVDEGYNKDLVFVPMTVNYDRVLEENSYLKEIRGREKKTESTSGFFKSSSLIKKRYGNVYMAFNEPFTLSEAREYLLNKKGISSSDELIVELGNYIINKINEVVVATPFALTTAAILNTTARGFSRDVIKDRFMLLLAYLRKTDFRLSEELENDENVDGLIDEVFLSYSKDDIIREVDIHGGEEGAASGLFNIDHEQRGRINIYKNTIMHMLLPLNIFSLASAAVWDSGRASRAKVIAEFDKIREILSGEFVYPDSLYDTAGSVESVAEHFVSQKILSRSGEDFIFTDNGAEAVKFFAGMIQDYLESLLIVSNALHESPVKMIPRKELVHLVRKEGMRMYHLSEVQCSESLSMINYNSMIDKLADMKVINLHGEGKASSVEIRDKKRLAELIQAMLDYLVKVRSN